MLPDRTVELLGRIIRDLEEVDFDLPSLDTRDVAANERVNTAQLAARVLRGFVEAERGTQFAILYAGARK